MHSLAKVFNTLQFLFFRASSLSLSFLLGSQPRSATPFPSQVVRIQFVLYKLKVKRTPTSKEAGNSHSLEAQALDVLFVLFFPYFTFPPFYNMGTVPLAFASLLFYFYRCRWIDSRREMVVQKRFFSRCRIHFKRGSVFHDQLTCECLLSARHHSVYQSPSSSQHQEVRTWISRQGN